MRIVQILPVFAYGDAIGNDTVALCEMIKDCGFKTAIYAEVIDSRIFIKEAKDISKYSCDEDDIILYHLSTGSELNYRIARYPCKKVVIYHNITPPVFFERYSVQAAKSCEDGLKAAKYLADKVDYALADSEFNRQDLLRMGYQCPVKVLPISIKFDDYRKKPNWKLIRKYKDPEYTNIIFTGRVAPNKKHEDLIKSFYYYKNYWNHKSRLFLVGGYAQTDPYYRKLRGYVEELELQDVFFTGHIKFDELLAYYKIADIFLCLSEHEGFCVPLVEAMYFDVPIIAYDNCAVGDTLGGSGILTKTRDPEIVAGLLNRVAEDKELAEQMIYGQKEALHRFEHTRIKKIFTQEIAEIIKG